MCWPRRPDPGALRAQSRGISLALPTRYRKYRQTGFATPSGRLEFYSEALRGAGQDPLPDFVAPAVPREARFPLTLTTAKWPQYCHSQQRNLPSLRRRMPDPLVEIHPETALARGIRDGDWVIVSTALATMRARAKLDRHLAPEVVCAQYGWWQFPDGVGRRQPPHRRRVFRSGRGVEQPALLPLRDFSGGRSLK
jgi:anaerobic selenocysteine-containing dehydrogenase